MAMIANITKVVKDVLRAWGCERPTPDPEETLRRLVRASGELHQALLEALSRSSGDNEQTLRWGLQTLEDQHLITPSETTQLRHIVDTIFSPVAPAAIVSEVQRVHKNLEETTPSPVAFMISSIARDSTITAATESANPDEGEDEAPSSKSDPASLPGEATPSKKKPPFRDLVVADLKGAISGAAAGKALGDSLGKPVEGAVIGGTVGAAVGSAEVKG
jgi:hypothetical protein